MATATATAMRTVAAVLLLCALVARTHAYGTLFADEVQPYKNAATHVTAVQSARYEVTTLSAGRLDSHNRNGFVVDTPGDVTADAADGLRVASQLGLTLGELGSTSSVVVEAQSSLSLTSSRIDVRATQAVVLAATSGDVRLESSALTVLEGADITVEAGGGMRAVATDGDLRWFGSDGFSMEAETALVSAQHRATVSSDVGDMFVQAVGGFTSQSNFVDVLGRNGVEMASSAGGVRFEAFAVLDMNGGTVDVDALDTVRLTSKEQSIVFVAATSVDFTADGDLESEVGRNVVFETTGDSESHILFSGDEGVSFVAGETLTLETTLPGSGIEIRTAGKMNVESTSFSLISKEIAMSADGVFNIDAALTIDLTVSKNNLVLNGGAFVDVTTPEDLDVVADDDIQLIGSNMRLDADETVTFSTDGITRIEADSPSGDLDINTGGDLELYAQEATFDVGRLSFTSDTHVFLDADDDFDIRGGLTGHVELVSLTDQVIDIRDDASAFSEVVSFLGTNILFDVANRTEIDAGDEVFLSSTTRTFFDVETDLFISVAGRLRSSASDSTFISADSQFFFAKDFVARGGDITIRDVQDATIDVVNTIMDSTDSIEVYANGVFEATSLDNVYFQGDDVEVTAFDRIFVNTSSTYWSIDGVTEFVAQGNVQLQSSSMDSDVMRFTSDADIEVSSLGELQVTVLNGILAEGVDDVEVESTRNFTVAAGSFHARAAASLVHSAGDNTTIVGEGQEWSAQELYHFTGGLATYRVLGGSGEFAITGGAVLMEAERDFSIDSDQAGVFWLAPEDRVEFSVLVERDLTMFTAENHTTTGVTLDAVSTGGEDITFFTEGPASVISSKSEEQQLEWSGDSITLEAFNGTVFSGVQNTFSGDVTLLDSVNTTRLEAGDDVEFRGGSFYSLSELDTELNATRLWATGSNSILLKTERQSIDMATLAPGENIEFHSGGPLSLQALGRNPTLVDFGFELLAGEDAIFTAGRSIAMVGVDAGAQPSLTLRSPVTNVREDVQIEALDGQVTIGGENLLVEATEPLNGEITMSATGNLFGQTEGGMRMVSNGANANGNGVELRTTDENGDIILEAVLADTLVEAFGRVAVTSDDINVLRGASGVVTGEEVEIFALDRAGDFHGFTGFTFTATDEFRLVAGDDAVLQARDRLSVGVTAGSLDVESARGHIRIATASAKDATFTAGDEHDFDGLAFNATAGQSLTVSTGSEELAQMVVTAGDGLRLSTIGGPIEFGTGTPEGREFDFTVTKEIEFESGRDLLTDSLSLRMAGLATKVYSEQGSVEVSAPAGDAFFSAVGAVRINSLGDRTTPRDGIALRSARDMVFTTPLMDWNAQHDVQVGTFRETSVLFTAGGSPSQAGFTIDSRGNQEWSAGDSFDVVADAQVTLEVGDHLALDAGGSMLLETTAAMGTVDRNIIVDSQLGSVFTYGGNITLTSETDLLSMTAVKSGIEFEHTGTATIISSSVNKLSVIGASSAGDVGPIEVVAGDSAAWRANTDFSFSTIAGNSGSITVQAAGALSVQSAGTMSGRTDLEAADLLIGANAASVEMLSRGATGSPIAISGTDLIQLESLSGDVSLSGKDVVLIADDSTGEDSRGSIEAVALENIYFESDEDSEFTGFKRVAVLSESGLVRMESSRDIAFEAGEDLFVVTSAFGGAGASIRLSTGERFKVDTNVDQGGDVVFSAADDVSWLARNWELEAQENALGFVDGSLDIFGTQRTVLHSEGSGAETVLSSQGELIVASGTVESGGTFQAFAGTIDGVPSSHEMEADHSTVWRGDVTRLVTDGENGGIVWEVEQSELVMQAQDVLLMTAGNDIRMVLDGVRGDQNTENVSYLNLDQSVGTWNARLPDEDWDLDGFGALLFSTEDFAVSAGDNVEIEAQQGVVVLAQRDLLLAANGDEGGVTLQSTANEGNIDVVLGYSRNHNAPGTSRSDSSVTAGGSIGIDATDEEGGTARLHSSSSFSLTALEEIDFRAQGSLGNIEVVAGVDSDSGHTANILFDAELNARFQSARRMSIDATDTALTADVVFHTQDGVIEVQQYGKSENSVGAELRAVHGDVLIVAEGSGEVVLEASREMNAAADDRVVLEAVGANSIVEINAGVMLLGSRGGDATLRSSDAMSFTMGNDFNVRQRSHLSDVFVDAATSLTLTSTNGLVGISSERGDVEVRNANYGKIQFLANRVDVDTDTRFTLPTTHLAGTNAQDSDLGPCPLVGEVRFFQSHGVATIDNHGELCVCINGNVWTCHRMGS